MSELYFRLGEMKGFTAIDLADKKEGYTNPIRELLQNSLDASREAGNNQCEINIYIETITRSQIPHIDEYRKVLQKAIETADQQGSYNANSKQIVKSIERALKKEELKVLMFSDNGTGMQQKQLDAILAGGVSIKRDKKSGGSFGVGNLSSYSLSSLRYVLYATKYETDNGRVDTLFTGSPILAGYKDDDEAQRGNRGRIVRKKPEGERNPSFDYPKKCPDFIESKMKNLDTGTVVAILGLSKSRVEKAKYAIVSNFFHPIIHGSLSVTVHHSGRSQEISDSEVEQLIDASKENKRAERESILSGKAVFQAWQAVMEDQKVIELSNSDKVYVYIKSDRNSDSTVVLIRNGMVIARHDSMLSRDMEKLRKETSFEPFTAVIDVDQGDAPKLFELVKGAESPYHNRLQAEILDSEDEKCLRDLFKELSGKIKEHLTEIKRDSFDLPLFEIPKDTAQAIGGTKSSGQDKRAKPKPKSRYSKPKPPKHGLEPKPPRPRPININRNLDAKNAACYKDKPDTWEVKLRTTPKQIDAADDVYLSMCLAEDNDEEKIKTYLNFVAVKVNEKSVDITEEPTNKSQVRLGRLEKEKPYDITAEVEKPDEIGGMRVALLPILRLKKRRSNEV